MSKNIYKKTNNLHYLYYITTNLQITHSECSDAQYEFLKTPRGLLQKLIML